MAGLIDPTEKVSPETHEGIKKLAVEFVTLLARHFNRDTIDALKLWERIGTAIESAYAKTPAGEPLLFLNLCLEHIDASRSRVLSDPEADRIMEMFENEDQAFAVSFIGYLKSRDYVVLTQAKRAWEAEKAARPKTKKEDA